VGGVRSYWWRFTGRDTSFSRLWAPAHIYVHKRGHHCVWRWCASL
jgi:hypothetical protein